MKITKIEAIPLIYPYEKPIFDASFCAAHRQAVLVKVSTDENIVGWGEAASFGGPPQITTTVIEEEIAPLIINENPLNIEKIWKKVYHRSYQHARGGLVICALSGVDIALWDIRAKYAKLPLYQLLGGYRDRVKAYASGGFYKEGEKTEDLAIAMKSYVDRGYQAVKVKVGRNHTPLNPIELMPHPEIAWTLEEDCQRVEAVRKAIGPDIQLIVDANAAWDAHTALMMGRRFEELGVYAFEEPISTDDIAGSAYLSEKLDIKIAGYETEQRLFGFRNLIAHRCVGMIQPDLTWAGGITECRKIAAFAQAYNISCSPHCFSSCVAVAASLHFLGSIPNGEFLEMDQNPNGLRTELIKEPIEIDRDGYVPILDKPGLGVEPLEDVMKKYEVK